MFKWSNHPYMDTHMACIILSPTHPSTASMRGGGYSCMCIIITRYGSGGWYSSRSRNRKLSAEKCWHSSDQGSSSEHSGWKVQALPQITSLLSTGWLSSSLPSAVSCATHRMNSWQLVLVFCNTLCTECNKFETVTWCNTVMYQKWGGGISDN